MSVWIVAIICLLIGTLLGAICVTFFPLPIPLADRGHRLFGVKNSHAMNIMAKILSEYGIKSRFYFEFGPSHQLVMKDHTTVLCWFDEDSVPREEMNAISVACQSPDAAAVEVANLLRQSGFSAEVKYPEGTEHVPFCILKTNALINSTLAFRRHVSKMPRPKAR